MHMVELPPLVQEARAKGDRKVGAQVVAGAGLICVWLGGVDCFSAPFQSGLWVLGDWGTHWCRGWCRPVLQFNIYRVSSFFLPV